MTEPMLNGLTEAETNASASVMGLTRPKPEPFNPDWDRVKALEESLREHMAEIQRLKALAQPAKWTPQRKPLTDEEMRLCFTSTNTSEPLSEGWPGLERFARAIEKAHGIE